MKTVQNLVNVTPVVTEMTVIPVAGRDSMLLNLSGAHGAYFTRNIVILKDSNGNTGVGEVPGGEGIRKTLEDAKELVVGSSIGNYNNILNTVRKELPVVMQADVDYKPLIYGLLSMLLQQLKQRY